MLHIYDIACYITSYIPCVKTIYTMSLLYNTFSPDFQNFIEVGSESRCDSMLYNMNTCYITRVKNYDTYYVI